MVCEKCDPLKCHRYDNVENTVIPIPAIALPRNEKIDWNILECRKCGQQFNVPQYDHE